MHLSPGARLGPYEIVEPVGAGGMGEVYRARDTRLKRDVALKVLAFGVSNDPARSARFEREARAAAALNHPNICTIYDTGVQDGVPYIVSEFLEGQTVRQLLEHGPISIRRVLDYATQAAEGLSAAHERGIVHRDFKPENLLLTAEGRLKILDFGIAKLAEDSAADDLTHIASTQRLTGAGIVIGTAGYMAPEQVRGQPCDSRSDIFSFGTVLFELVTGRRLFQGDTPADTASAILNDDPPDHLTAQNGTPPIVERIIHRCVEKSPRDRFQSAGDLAFALKALPGTTTSVLASAASAPRRRVRRLSMALAVVAGVAVLAMAAVRSQPTAIDQMRLRFTPFAMDAEAEGTPVWSPDGRTLAYRKYIDGRRQVLVRSIEAGEPFQLTHVRTADGAEPEFWSSDGARVAYVTADGLWSVSRAGGDPEIIAKGAIESASLAPDGSALAIWRITQSAAGEEGSVWISTPPSAEPRRYEPAPFAVKGAINGSFLRFSPDGANLLLLSVDNTAEIRAWLLPYPPSSQHPPREVISALTRQQAPSSFSWLPDSRHVIMGMTAPAAPFGGLWMVDVMTGDVAPITIGLTPHSEPDVAPDGSTVAFVAGQITSALAAVPLDGSPVRDLLATASGEYSGAWVPGQQKIVYVTRRTGREEIRIRSTEDGSDRSVLAMTALPSGTKVLSSPAVSSDGQRMAFHVWGGDSLGSIWIVPVAGGAPVRISPAGATQVAAEWSPNGRDLACLDIQNGRVRLVVQRVGSGSEPRVLSPSVGETPSLPAWSPDGKWIAYGTDAGVEMIQPDGTNLRRISVTGSSVAWSPDSRVLYTIGAARDGNNALFAVDAASGSVRVITTFPADTDFNTPTSPGQRLTMSPDGKNLLATVARTAKDIWLLRDFRPTTPLTRLRDGFSRLFRMPR